MENLEQSAEALIGYLRRDLMYLEGVSDALKPNTAQAIKAKLVTIRTNVNMLEKMLKP